MEALDLFPSRSLPPVPDAARGFIADQVDGPRARISRAGDCRSFMLAGNATLTIVSHKTDTRFTYRVRCPEDQRDQDVDTYGRVWFVSLLTGSNNEEDFSYIGCIFSGRANFVYGRKSHVGVGAPGVKAFDWFSRFLLSPTSPGLPASLEVWHEGRCSRCGRKLTVPESIARGLGPECAGM
jgi:hypothetical protein